MASFINAGLTPLQLPTTAVAGFAGDGSLGAITISSDVEANGRKNYLSLTVDVTFSLWATAGRPLIVLSQGSVTANGSIHADGRGPVPPGIGSVGGDRDAVVSTLAPALTTPPRILGNYIAGAGAGGSGGAGQRTSVFAALNASGAGTDATHVPDFYQSIGVPVGGSAAAASTGGSVTGNPGNPGNP